MRMINVTRHDTPRPIRIEGELPQNDLPVVICRTEILHDMYKHAYEEMHHEIGGYLLGFPALNVTDGRSLTYIDMAIRAIYDSTPTHVTIHPASFNEVENVRQKESTILVGWYHSHPRLSIFVSGTDIMNHKNYHSENYQIAIVVDPSKTHNPEKDSSFEWIGFFCWDADKTLRRLPTENTIFVSQRPKVELAAVESHSTKWNPVEQEIDVFTAIESARNLVKSGVLNNQLPLIRLSKEAKASLVNSDPNSSMPAFLLGEIDLLAGLYVIRVNQIDPIDPQRTNHRKEKVWGIFRAKRNLESNHSLTLEGPRSVGLCFGAREWEDSFSFLKTHSAAKEFEVLSRECTKPCIVALIPPLGQERSISFLMWMESRGGFLTIPSNRIVVR